MNKKGSTAVKVILGAALVVALLCGVFYYVSYNLKSNAVADIINKGNDYMSIECYDEAVECYEMALEKEEGNERIINAIVAAYYEKGKSCKDSKEAIEAFENAIKYDSDNRSAYWAIAERYESEGDAERMLQVLRKGYENTLDASMDTKIAKIETDAAKKKAEEEAKAEEEEKLLEMRKKQEEMLKPLFELFEKEDLDSAISMVRQSDYQTYSDEVSGDVSYYYGDLDDDGKREGMGIALYENGFYYFGEYKRDLRSGQGIWLKGYPSGATIEVYYYKGEFKNDKPNGDGCVTVINDSSQVEGLDFTEEVTTGYFRNGYEEGEMKTTTKNQIGKTEEFSYTVKEGMAEAIDGSSKNAGTYIYAQSRGGNASLVSDGTARGVEGFVERESDDKEEADASMSDDPQNVDDGNETEN